MQRSVCVAQNKSVAIDQSVSMLRLDQDELGEFLPPHPLLCSHKAMVTMSTPDWHLKAVARDVHISWAGKYIRVSTMIGKMKQTLTIVQEAHFCLLSKNCCLC